MKKNWPLYPAIFLIAMATLAQEVILSRMFSLTFWHHFGFMILSIALFGVSFGAILVFFTNRFFKKFIPLTLAVLSVAFAISIPLVLMRLNLIPLEMNLIIENGEHQELFKEFLGFLVIPFVLGGYIFASIFTNFSKDINKLYFFDLIGGGIGCYFALLIFPGRGPIITSVITGALVLAAAGFFALKFRWYLAMPFFAGIYFFTTIFYPMAVKFDNEKDPKKGGVRVSEEKRDLDKQGVRLFRAWDNFGHVAIHEKQNGVKYITVDYSCFTYFMGPRTKEEVKGYRNSSLATHWYPYLFSKAPQDVAIVGVGAGKDIVLALIADSQNIYGAEFNKTVTDIYRKFYRGELKVINHGEDYKIYNIADLPNVHIVNDEGRFFIKSSKKKFDILVFDNAMSQVAVSSGSFTLAESYLYTVEGIIDYVSHLKENGILYLSNPYVEGPRFASVIREAFKQMGREDEFKESIMIAHEPGSYQKTKIVVKNGIFTPEESNRFINYAHSIGHQLVYSPYSKTTSKEERIILTNNVQEEYDRSDTEIRPSTDDWPFFTQYIKPTSQELSQGIYAAKNFYPQPFLMLRKITIQVAEYAIYFLLLPLVFLNIGGLRKLKNKLGSMVYFSSLGLSFMLIEVVMMQKYALMLGHPVYSFAVVLSTLLISSGIGSIVSERFKDPYKVILGGLAGIAISTFIAFFIISFFGPALIGSSFAVRAGTVIALVAFSGVFMGVMMPSGIRAISDVPSSIPWMWSLNGIFSVLASFFAINISILHGFNSVFLIGLAVYAFGTLVFAPFGMLRKR